MRRLILLAVALSLTACASARSIGYKETYKLEPARCSAPGVVKRDGACYQRTIWGLKDTGKIREEVTSNADGSKTKITEIDNAGHPGPLHDAATLVSTGFAARIANPED